MVACVRECICDENTRWGQIPDSESLLHATTVRLRSNGNRWVPRTPPITPPLAAGGESRAGGRADTTYLPRIHRRKSQENTSVVLWRSFPSHTCVVQGFRYALAAVRKAVGAFAASEGGVVAQRCWNTSPRWKTLCKRIWISFPLLLLDYCLLATPGRFPLTFSLPLILWNKTRFGNARKNKVQPRWWWARFEDSAAQRGGIPAWDQLRGEGKIAYKS